jgi:hypothetical protein
MLGDFAEKHAAEAATGCRARAVNGGALWLDGGDGEGILVSDTAARQALHEGKAVHAPAAGAGSYRDILRRLGFKWVKVEDWTSSAGDWCFRVWNQRLVFQSNRFPRHGFSFTLANAEDCQP